MQLKTGHLLAGGRYRVERVLGQGGFGITYLAEQTGLSRKVAVKEFFMKQLCNRDSDTSQVSMPSLGSRELVTRYREKFIKEARSIARLKHKNIVRIIDIFEDNNTAYYVMEYVGGGSLNDRVLSGPLPEADAVRYIRQLASALEYVHSNRIMHLDVKPGNVLLSEEDEAVLIDFGLSKQYDSSGAQTSSTPVGISHGYAPLEQYKSGGVGTFSPATDIYSLGATFYKLLTGETPPEAADVSDEGLPALPEGLSAPVRRAVEAAMQPGRRNRPQSIGEFIALLENGNVKTENGKEDDDGETVVIPVIPTKRSEKSQNENKPTDPVIPNGSEKSPSKPAEKEIPLSARNDKNGNANDKSNKTNDKPSDRVILNNSEKSPKKSSGKKWFIIAAVAIIAVVAVIFGINSGGDNQSGNSRKREARRERMERKRLEEETKSYGFINGHQYVNLGLPSGIKWATCNVGANDPETYGNFYAWGETSTKDSYTNENCSTHNISMYDISGVSWYDAARSEWGGSWRLPTKAEFEELMEYCTYERTTSSGVSGYRFTSINNGNTLFLPAAGSYDGTSHKYKEASGLYWSSTPDENDYNAWYLLFNDAQFIGPYNYGRYIGNSVRPVSD